VDETLQTNWSRTGGKLPGTITGLGEAFPWRFPLGGTIASTTKLLGIDN
jgi:hypothetical protein